MKINCTLDSGQFKKWSRQLLFKLLSQRHIIYRLEWWKCSFGPIIVWIHVLQPEQDPPVYYSIVILTILYYLRVADLMGITSPYPRENIIAGNYILADMQAYLNKCHRQQNKEILIRHSPVNRWVFFVFKYSINRKK